MFVEIQKMSRGATINYKQLFGCQELYYKENILENCVHLVSTVRNCYYRGKIIQHQDGPMVELYIRLHTSSGEKS